METVVCKNELLKEKAELGMNYKEYRQLLDNLWEQGKTTGSNQSEEYQGYAKLNLARMKRLDKTLELNIELVEAVQNIKTSYYWLVLTEGWCGDAAQNIPVLAKLADLSDKIKLKLVLRDEHLDLMDEYLTNGGRSIPKLIAIEKDTCEVVGTWGPRPAPVQQMVIDNKHAENPLPYSEFAPKAQLWYAKDKTQTVQGELLSLLEQMGA